MKLLYVIAATLQNFPQEILAATLQPMTFSSLGSPLLLWQTQPDSGLTAALIPLGAPFPNTFYSHGSAM